MSDHYVTPDAPRSIDVSACIQCGLCLPHCPTYRLTGRERYSPRGRLSAMAAVLDGIATVDAAFDDALSTCLGCLACEAVCPGLVPYGRALEGARAELAAQRPTPGRRSRKILLGGVLRSDTILGLATSGIALAQRLRAGFALPPALRRSLSGLRAQSFVRRPWKGRSVSAAGRRRGTVMMLSGCVMDPWFQPVHDAAVGVMARAGYDVVFPEGQTCCGALAAHDGRVDEARRMARVNNDAFSGVDVIVSDSAGCTAHLKNYDHWAPTGSDVAARTEDVTEFVAGLIHDGVLPTLPATGRRVAVQDPCHLRHAQRIVNEPRAILRAAGYEPVEIDPDGLCCGAAGTYSLLHPETSHELGVRKADQIVATGVDLVASANPGCEMQLRAHLAPAYRIAHPVELYWEALTGTRYW